VLSHRLFNFSLQFNRILHFYLRFLVFTPTLFIQNDYTYNTYMYRPIVYGEHCLLFFNYIATCGPILGNELANMLPRRD
jgi:hypothetical protein